MTKDDRGKKDEKRKFLRNLRQSSSVVHRPVAHFFLGCRQGLILKLYEETAHLFSPFHTVSIGFSQFLPHLSLISSLIFLHVIHLRTFELISTSDSVRSARSLSRSQVGIWNVPKGSSTSTSDSGFGCSQVGPGVHPDWVPRTFRCIHAGFRHPVPQGSGVQSRLASARFGRSTATI